EIAIEVAAAARDPVDAPAHSLSIGEELLERRSGREQQRRVSGLQVDDLWRECVGDRRADSASRRVGRAEHEVVDEQLRAAVEELGEGLLAVLSVERVVLLHLHPGELPALARELVAAARELLLLLQEFVALCLPRFLGRDSAPGHRLVASTVSYSS